MREFLNTIKEASLGLLYPDSIYCMSCGNIIDKSRPYSLCDSCIRGVEWASGSKCCRKCGKFLRQGGEKNLCDSCAEGGWLFDRGFSCAEYGGVREVARGFKYGGRAYSGNAISEIMFDRVFGELPEIDILLPVPMHRDKERKRGYNQADILGGLLAKKLGLPYDRHALTRGRATGAMSKLGSSVRADNIHGAISATPGKAKLIKGKRVLLVDDIYTTGSTVNECARELKANGAAAVYFVVFATGSDDM